MSTSNAYTGEYHILLRLKGPADRISLFHRLIKKCDGDWPFIDRAQIRACLKCCGVVWSSPRLGPEDFKAAARQVGGGLRVKIRNFAPGKNCFPNPTDEKVKSLTPTEANALYAANGVKIFREKYISPMVTPIPVTALAVIPPSEDYLIGEVLAEGNTTAPPVPAAPEGSLVQSPGVPTDLHGRPVSRFDQSHNSSESWGDMDWSGYSVQ
jgi:hypothetical protein